MNCPSCHHENRDGARFCEACGAKLDKSCVNCAEPLSDQARFCPSCGTPVESPPDKSTGKARDVATYTPKHLADKILQSRSVLEGERKHVTILFADVKGSMDLAGQLDPETWHEILDKFFEILTAGVHRFEGTVNQYTGDGIMALFGAPIAHEDHAQRACYAALQLRDQLRTYADQVRLEHGVPFGVRIGINTGDVVVGKIGDDLRMDYTAQGHTVGLAQRMEQLAESGRVYLTDDTKRLITGFFVTRDLGQANIKGMDAPVGVHELESTGTSKTRLDVSRARGLTKFVGRADEIQILETALERAQAGHGQVVGVVGEPGVGKSRLCHEFVETCRNTGTPVYAAHCPAHGKNIPYIPILELYRNYFGIKGDDSPSEARQKIAGAMLLLDEELRGRLPALFDFMGVAENDVPAHKTDADTLQRQLFAIIHQAFRSQAERGLSQVIYFDDLHWIDPGSDVFVDQLVQAANGNRVLILLNFRPEYQAAWMRKPHYHQLPLTPLDTDSVRDLVQSILGDNETLIGLAQRIIEWTGGNPFFTEEVINELIEAGHLSGERGDFRLSSEVGSLEVPTNVRAVLAARIDRLPDDAKQLLQSASVIGKSFNGPLLEHVTEFSTDALAPSIDVLKLGDFIYESSLYPVVEYTFKHPLTHEVAYNSQLETRRASAHARAAQAIEALNPERVNEHSALIAYHWDTAGDAENAARWYDQAAAWVGFSDPVAATRHWNRIAELIPRLPESAEFARIGAEACANLMSYQWMIGRSREDTERTFEQGRKLAEIIDDPILQSRLIGSKSVAHASLGHGKEWQENLDTALTLARDANDFEHEMAWQMHLAYTYSFTGKNTKCITHAKSVLERLPDDPHFGAEIASQNLRAAVETSLSMSHTGLGNFEQARHHARNVIEVSTEHTSPNQLMIGYLLTGRTFVLEGNREAAISNARIAVEMAGDSEVMVIRYCLNMATGFSHFANEEWSDAATAFEIARQAAYDQFAGRIFCCSIIGYLAESLLNAGQIDDAYEHASMIVAFAREGGIQWDIKPWFALSRVLIAQDKQTEAQHLIDETSDALIAAESPVYEPFLFELRAEFAERFENANKRQESLRQAQEKFAALGAVGHERRIATLLAK